MACLKFSIDMIDATPATTETIRRERRLARAAQIIDRPSGFRILLAGAVLVWLSLPTTDIALPHVVRAACTIGAGIGLALMVLFALSVAASLPLMIVGRFKLDPSDYVTSLRDATPDQVANLAQYLGYIEITTYMSRVAALGRPLLAGEAEMLERAAVWDLPRKEREARLRLREPDYLRMIAERTGLQCAAESSPAAISSAN